MCGIVGIAFFDSSARPLPGELDTMCDSILHRGPDEGGGQREDDLTALQDKIKQHDLPDEAFEWYLDLRRYGTVPHAGFGLGIERTVTWLCGLSHVRETIPFPRMMDRLRP